MELLTTFADRAPATVRVVFVGCDVFPSQPQLCMFLDRAAAIGLCVFCRGANGAPANMWCACVELLGRFLSM